MMELDRIRPWDLLHKALPNSSIGDFGFNVPMQMVKGRTPQEGQRPVRGVASTPHKDLQEEDVLQKGLDTGYFTKYGFYNDDHKPGAENKVGQPTVGLVKSVEDRYGKKTSGLWTEGFMWKAGLHRGADALWELAKAMDGSDSDRNMGFSIQGKVLQRDGKRIVKAWIQDIAITASPINTYTWLELVSDLGKSVWANQGDVLDLRKSVRSMDMFKSSSLLDADGWEELRKEEEDEKQLKALSAASNPMVPQALEDGLKITTYSTGGCAPADKKNNSVSKALRMCYYQARTRGWSPSNSRALAIATVTQNILS